MKVHNRIYLVKDKFGNKASASCEEGCDTIQICGLKKANGENYYFESEAYHLSNDCQNEENGLECKMIEDVHDFDKLWEQSK